MGVCLRPMRLLGGEATQEVTMDAIEEASQEDINTMRLRRRPQRKARGQLLSLKKNMR